MFPIATVNRTRRGISLMEVLISVFILSVGLMGLLALIPIGSLDVLEAVKSDRGSTAGRAVHREVKVCKMCYPDMWMNHMWSDDPAAGTRHFTWPQTCWEIDEPGAPESWPPGSPTDETLPWPAGFPRPWPVDEGHSICIDPLYIARAHQPFVASGGSLPADWPGRAFPYYLDNDPAGPLGPVPEIRQPSPPAVPQQPPRMSRVTLRAWPSRFAPMMSYGLADRIFSWQDDLTFNLPTDATLRPEAQLSLGGRPQSDGNYTWMATLTPAEGHADMPTLQRRLYNYSVVVFYKRNLNQPVLNPASVTGTAFPYTTCWQLADRSGGPPSERVVFADMLTPGVSFGGGDVRLRLVVQSGAPNDDASRPEISDFTTVRPGNWILLSGYLVPPAGADPEWHRSVFQWYRVIALGDGPTLMDASLTPSGQPEWVRDVSLAGPDWQAGLFQDSDTSATYGTLYATLVEGVVAVFSKTIELDTWSGW